MEIPLLHTAIIAFFSAFLGGLIPLKRQKFQHYEWVHYIDLLCDGMFLAIALTHLLPEIYHDNNLFTFGLLSVLIVATTYLIIHFSKSKNHHIKYMLMYILFLHCFIEGLAIPIVSDDVQTTLSIAVLAHKALEPFVFFNLISRYHWSERKLYLLLIFMASLTPLGILAGYSILSFPNIIISIINAITCGTFLGISINCYLNQTCSHHHHEKKWVFLIFMLFSIMLMSLQGHDHHHHGHHEHHHHEHH